MRTRVRQNIEMSPFGKVISLAYLHKQLHKSNHRQSRDRVSFVQSATIKKARGETRYGIVALLSLPFRLQCAARVIHSQLPTSSAAPDRIHISLY